MTKLSVNVNKIATLFIAWVGVILIVMKLALDCVRFGSDDIIVHPRPDERHIRPADVYLLKNYLKTEFNIEGYPSKDFMTLVSEVKPTQVTLVPDSPEQLTSNHGWNVQENFSFLKDILEEMKSAGIRSSIFVDADSSMVEWVAKVGADRVELYTEPYAAYYEMNRTQAIAPFVSAAKTAKSCGLGLNAGHDLNLENLAFLKQSIPWIDEVSIGHALICDSLYLGLENTIMEYKKRLL